MVVNGTKVSSQQRNDTPRAINDARSRCRPFDYLAGATGGFQDACAVHPDQCLRRGQAVAGSSVILKTDEERGNQSLGQRVRRGLQPFQQRRAHGRVAAADLDHAPPCRRHDQPLANSTAKTALCHVPISHTDQYLTAYENTPTTASRRTRPFEVDRAAASTHPLFMAGINLLYPSVLRTLQFKFSRGFSQIHPTERGADAGHAS